MSETSRRRLVWIVSGVLLVAWVMVAAANFGPQDLWHHLDDSRNLIEVYRPLILTAALVMFGAALAWQIYSLGDHELRKRDDVERKYQRMLDLTPDIIALIDISGAIRAVNPAVNLILGYPPEELVGQNALRFVHPDEASRAQDVASLNHWSTAKAEVRCLRRDGTCVWTEWNAVLLPERREMYCVGRDISERKAHEEERARLERMQREFVSTVSHEVRTPLTSIYGALETLRARMAPGLDPQFAKLLVIAARNTERLVRLVNEVLDLERIDSGRTELFPEVCTASALIDQSIAGIRPLLDNARTHVEIEGGEAQVLVDPDKAVQVLTNLLSNAVKFSEPGTTVTVRARSTNTEVVFSVLDRGRGIPHDHLDRIFHPFHQVDVSDSRRQAGAGLGLAIVKSLVEKMGGRIWVESQVGAGSCFSFALSKAPPPSPAHSDWSGAEGEESEQAGAEFPPGIGAC